MSDESPCLSSVTYVNYTSISSVYSCYIGTIEQYVNTKYIFFV
jgi:hypothetical protein